MEKNTISNLVEWLKMFQNSLLVARISVIMDWIHAKFVNHLLHQTSVLQIQKPIKRLVKKNLFSAKEQQRLEPDADIQRVLPMVIVINIQANIKAELTVIQLQLSSIAVKVIIQLHHTVVPGLNQEALVKEK